MAFHEFAHVELNQRLFTAKEELGQGFRGQRFTHAGWPQEHKGANRALGILQTGTRAAHRPTDRLERFILANNALAQHLFHLQQTLALFTGDAVDRHPRPHGHHFGNIFGVDLGLIGRFVPTFAQLIEARFQLYLTVAQIDSVIKALSLQRFILLLLQLFETHKGLTQVGGKGRFVHAYATASFVDQIDRLIGHKTIRHITGGKVGRSRKGLVGNNQLVMLFVANLDAAQDLNRLFDRRLIDHHRLEAALQGCIALDIFAILIERRRPNHL